MESSNLLRMLEPVVRPGNLPAPHRPSAGPPIETRPFESLLAEARSLNEVDATEAPGKVEGDGHEQGVKETTAGWFGRLAQVDAVENASLRELINRRVETKAAGDQ